MNEKSRILITGGGGFIGSHLAEELKDDYLVRIFDKKYFSHQNIETFEEDVEVLEGDFHNIKDVEAAVDGVDVVIHLAWSTLPAMSNANYRYDVETNIIPLLNALDLLNKKPIRKFIFISSGGTVYGNVENMPIREEERTHPLCSYGITKLMAEKYLFLNRHLFDLDYTVLRLANPYGERQNVQNRQGLIVTLLFDAIHHVPIEIWGDGTVVRDYLYIKDAARCVKKAIPYQGTQKLFNVSSGEGHSINEILETIAAVTGTSVDVRYKEARKFDVQRNVLDNVLACRELGWRPEVGLEQGIEKVYQWMKRRNPEEIGHP